MNPHDPHDPHDPHNPHNPYNPNDPNVISAKAQTTKILSVGNMFSFKLSHSITIVALCLNKPSLNGDRHHCKIMILNDSDPDLFNRWVIGSVRERIFFANNPSLQLVAEVCDAI